MITVNSSPQDYNSEQDSDYNLTYGSSASELSEKGGNYRSDGTLRIVLDDSPKHKCPGTPKTESVRVLLDTDTEELSYV